MNRLPALTIPDFASLLPAAALLAAVLLATSARAQESEFGALFLAPGAEETYYACAACHSERLVSQQGITREGWEEVFEQMVEEHGMAEIEEPERTVILDYLATHYNTDRPHFSAP